MDTIDLTDRRRSTGSPVRPESPGIPRVVVSCIDARTDPVHLFGIEPGEAAVFRTVGGRLSDSTIEEIGMIAGLAKVVGGDEMELDLAIVHHTDCGAARFAMPPVRQKVAQVAGIDGEDVDAYTIDDPADSLREDVARLRSSALPGGLRVSGYVYDVGTGELSEEIATETLRSGEHDTSAATP